MESVVEVPSGTRESTVSVDQQNLAGEIVAKNVSVDTSAVIAKPDQQVVTTGLMQVVGGAAGMTAPTTDETTKLPVDFSAYKDVECSLGDLGAGDTVILNARDILTNTGFMSRLVYSAGKLVIRVILRWARARTDVGFMHVSVGDLAAYEAVITTFEREAIILFPFLLPKGLLSTNGSHVILRAVRAVVHSTTDVAAPPAKLAVTCSVERFDPFAYDTEILSVVPQAGMAVNAAGMRMFGREDDALTPGPPLISMKLDNLCISEHRFKTFNDVLAVPRHMFFKLTPTLTSNTVLIPILSDMSLWFNDMFLGAQMTFKVKIRAIMSPFQQLTGRLFRDSRGLEVATPHTVLNLTQGDELVLVLEPHSLTRRGGVGDVGGSTAQECLYLSYRTSTDSTQDPIYLQVTTTAVNTRAKIPALRGVKSVFNDIGIEMPETPGEVEAQSGQLYPLQEYPFGREAIDLTLAEYAGISGYNGYRDVNAGDLVRDDPYVWAMTGDVYNVPLHKVWSRFCFARGDNKLSLSVGDTEVTFYASFDVAGESSHGVWAGLHVVRGCYASITAPYFATDRPSRSLTQFVYRISDSARVHHFVAGLPNYEFYGLTAGFWEEHQAMKSLANLSGYVQLYHTVTTSPLSPWHVTKYQDVDPRSYVAGSLRSLRRPKVLTAPESTPIVFRAKAVGRPSKEPNLVFATPFSSASQSARQSVNTAPAGGQPVFEVTEEDSEPLPTSRRSSTGSETKKVEATG